MLKLIFSLLLICVAPTVAPDMSVTFPSSGTANVSWSGFSGSGDYDVKVEALPLLTLHYHTTTSNTSTTVNGLTSSVTYRYTVTRGSEFIITELDTP